MHYSMSNFSFIVSQLRGHWEDTSGKVQARKNQLEELSEDARHFELKQQEIEAWLTRMETWHSRQRPVGTTQELLDQQTRDLKVMGNYCAVAEFERYFQRVMMPNKSAKDLF